MNACSKREADVRERIANDLKHHVVTERHAVGLYRHWRCQKPDTWCMGFDIVTWPGSLCFTGDMGDYLFQRTADMVAFMESACKSYDYAAEKCVAHDGRLEEFSGELLEEVLAEVLAEKPDTAEAIQDIRSAYSECDNGHDAYRAMYESNLWDGCDMPSCEIYTFHFLWCLHAIKWFCAELNAGRVVAMTEASA